MEWTRRQVLAAGGAVALGGFLSSDQRSEPWLHRGLRQPITAYTVKPVVLVSSDQPVDSSVVARYLDGFFAGINRVYADTGQLLTPDSVIDVVELDASAHTLANEPGSDQFTLVVPKETPPFVPKTKYVCAVTYDNDDLVAANVTLIGGPSALIAFDEKQRNNPGFNDLDQVIEHEVAHTLGAIHTQGTESDLMFGGDRKFDARLQLGYENDPRGPQSSENRKLRTSKWFRPPPAVETEFSSHGLDLSKYGQRLTGLYPSSNPVSWTPIPTFESWCVEYERAAIALDGHEVRILEGPSLDRWRAGQPYRGFPDVSVIRLPEPLSLIEPRPDMTPPGNWPSAPTPMSSRVGSLPASVSGASVASAACSNPSQTSSIAKAPQLRL